MSRSLLLDTYCGELTVKIEGVGTCRLELTSEDATLFDYVEQACAKLCGAQKDRPRARTKPDDWFIQRFIPAFRALNVIQKSGERMVPKPAAEKPPAGAVA